MNNTICNLSMATLFLSVSYSAQSQGAFVNLDFEQANVPVVPSGQFGSDVLSTDGVPGWTTYMGGGQVNTILHNNVTLSAAEIALFGPDWSPSQILQGSYSLLVAASRAGPAITSAIAQVGQVPQSAMSLVFFLGPADSLGVAFAGQQIPLVQIGSAANYKILAGDISAFAGQTGELRFTAPLGGGGLLDSIEFSTQSIPEPSVFGLLALGVITLGLRRTTRGT